jgi:hypothetical protein
VQRICQVAAKHAIDRLGADGVFVQLIDRVEQLLGIGVGDEPSGDEQQREGVWLASLTPIYVRALLQHAASFFDSIDSIDCRRLPEGRLIRLVLLADIASNRVGDQ